MKFLRFFLPLCAVALGACESIPTSTPRYTKFRVTNHRGDLVADWVAEGPWHSVGDRYEIKAVERTSAPPFSENTHYPNGWRTSLTGANIIHWRVGKPYWLYELDRN